MNETDNCPSYSVGELADAVGISRRAIRFYVQRGLLPPPDGRGRGARYTAAHRERLDAIGRLQDAGHPLETIQAILDGTMREAESTIPAVSRGNRSRPTGLSRWLRIDLQPGIELHVDTDRSPLDAKTLLTLQTALIAALATQHQETDDDDDATTL
jgi:DNA-binding transcriptional MerR regulator